MPSTKGIRAGRAFVELFADDSKLVRGLRRARRKIRAFGDRIRNLGLRVAAAGAGMLAPLLASTKVFSRMGDQVAKMAKRTGLSVEALSELRFVASQTGTSLEAMETGFRRMQRSIYDAGRGLSTQTDALADLGLEYRDLAGLSPEQQFKRLAEAIGRVEDPTRKAALAQALFGRAGTQLLPMMAEGVAGIEALQEEARRLGLTMSGEDARAAEEFTDTLDRLWKVVKMGVFHIGAALAPVLEDVAETITTVTGKVSDWIKAHRQWLVVTLKVVAATLGVGIALTALGTMISAVGTALGALIATITAVGVALKAVGAVIAFLLTPIGAVIAAVGALGAYLVHASGAGGKALVWLGERFNHLRDTALAAYQGIADALAAGDMSLAVKVLWTTIKMEWTRGVNALEKSWLSFRNTFIKIGYDAWYGLLSVVQTVWHALEVGWIETTAFFAKAWTNFTGFFAKTWERIKANAQKAWNWIRSLFDDSVNLAAENRYVEQRKRVAIRGIEDDKQRKLASRESRRQAARNRADATHEATLSRLGQENMDARRELDAGFQQKMARNEQELAQARTEWNDALAEARTKREAAETGGKDDDLDTGLKDAKEILAGLGDVGALVRDQAAKIGVKGTFNAAAARALEAGDAADRTAKATEETAKNTKKLAQVARSGGLTFA